MPNIRDTYPHLAPIGSLSTDPPEDQVRFELDQKIGQLIRKYSDHARDPRLPILERIVAPIIKRRNEDG